MRHDVHDPAEPAVACHGLSLDYGPTSALCSVDMVVPRGSVTGLLGPNGAGKTSLIRVLTTIERPTAGSFEVLGHGPSDAVEIRRCVGVLPEGGGFPRRTRAVDHLRYLARLHGADDDDARRRARDLLERVGLGLRATDPIGSYSRGMRQRLGLCAALVGEPRVLFLDEPTLGLDPAGKEATLALIAELAGVKAVSVVLTSHLLDEIERVCDRAVILTHGRVAFEGTREELAQRSDRTGFRVHVPPGDLDRAVRTLGSDGVQVHAGMTDASVDVRSIDPAGAVRALVAAGVDVLALVPTGPGLTEMFLEITRSRA